MRCRAHVHPLLAGVRTVHIADGFSICENPCVTRKFFYRCMDRTYSRTIVRGHDQQCAIELPLTDDH